MKNGEKEVKAFVKALEEYKNGGSEEKMLIALENTGTANLTEIPEEVESELEYWADAFFGPPGVALSVRWTPEMDGFLSTFKAVVEKAYK